MKAKSSMVLELAMAKIVSGNQRFTCAAIVDVETDLRYESGENVTSNATKLFMGRKPKHIPDDMKGMQPWWPVGDPERIKAIEATIKQARSNND